VEWGIIIFISDHLGSFFYWVLNCQAFWVYFIVRNGDLRKAPWSNMFPNFQVPGSVALTCNILTLGPYLGKAPLLPPQACFYITYTSKKKRSKAKLAKWHSFRKHLLLSMGRQPPKTPLYLAASSEDRRSATDPCPV
jgi:hypothetical protein